MKYTMRVSAIILMLILLCSVASAQTNKEMEARNHQIAANVTMFIVHNVMNQQQNGMINSSSFNNITNDAVTMAINEMTADNGDNNQTFEDTNLTNATFTVTISPDNANTSFIEGLLKIISNWI